MLWPTNFTFNFNFVILYISRITKKFHMQKTYYKYWSFDWESFAPHYTKTLKSIKNSTKSDHTLKLKREWPSNSPPYDLHRCLISPCDWAADDRCCLYNAERGFSANYIEKYNQTVQAWQRELKALERAVQTQQPKKTHQTLLLQLALSERASSTASPPAGSPSAPPVPWNACTDNKQQA